MGLRVVAILALVLVPIAAPGQSTARRLTTIHAVRQFPSYFHLQNVLLRGEFVEQESRIVLRADEHELRVVSNDVRTRSGAVEVRGLVIDVGRLEPGDPRLGRYGEGRDGERWPRPGEEIIISLNAVAEAQPAVVPTVRALALEPWKFEDQTVTVVGAFRGRNLFGDLPDAPGKSRYDFVMRGAEGAVWVTGLRPRGRGFDLDVDRRMDAGQWLQVTGVVAHERGLVSIAAKQVASAKEPEAVEPTEESAAPPVPPLPVEVIFSSPTQGETEVPTTTSVRLQFSRGLREATLAGRLRVAYSGVSTSEAVTEFRTAYDAANRAVEIRFTRPLEPFRTVRVEVLEGIQGFDGAPLQPWTLSFGVGAP